jgi:hypothetical protein
MDHFYEKKYRYLGFDILIHHFFGFVPQAVLGLATIKNGEKIFLICLLLLSPVPQNKSYPWLRRPTIRILLNPLALKSEQIITSGPKILLPGNGPKKGMFPLKSVPLRAFPAGREV